MRSSAYGNSRPIAAPICASRFTEPKRSSRAISEACNVVGIANGGNALSSTYRSASARSKPLSKTVLVNSSTKSGTPSVRSAIWSTSSSGSALLPESCATKVMRSRRSRRLGLRAEGDEQQDRQGAETLDGEVEQFARGRIDPMCVLEDHHNRLLPRH